MKKSIFCFMVFWCLTANLLPAAEEVARTVSTELSRIAVSTSFEAPFIVRSSAYFIDGVTGPLVKLTHANAPHFFALVTAICKRLKIPIPTLYLNCGDDSFNISQGALTPSLSHVIIGKQLAADYDDAEIMRSFLHECGHNVYHHNVKLGMAGLVVLSLWLWWLTHSDVETGAKVVGSASFLLFFDVFFMWYARYNEYMADRYEADHCENPEDTLALWKRRDAETPEDSFASWKECLRYYLATNHPPEKARLEAQIKRLEDRLKHAR